MLELNEALTSVEDEVSDDFPPALLSYFETSKTRAAVCEKLILQELEDFASDCTENMTSWSKEFSEDMVKLSEQISGGTENEENKTDGCLPQMPTKTQSPLPHSVTVCPDNEAFRLPTLASESNLGFSILPKDTLACSPEPPEIEPPTSRSQDGAGIDRYMGNEEYLPLDSIKYESEKEKHKSEEMHKKEERHQREMNFQEELRRIMEAEKLHQKKLESLEKRAQEKLEQELLLQQELIGNLQKQVEQEKRMIEEEKKRKREEDKRKRNEMQEKRKREEEDNRTMKKEDEKIKPEKEPERQILEERKRLCEEEKKNVVKLRLKEDKKQEELWKREEEEIRKEERRKMEEIQLKEEEKRGEKQEVEEEKQKEEKERKEKRIREDKETRIKEDEKNMMEVAGNKVTEAQKRQNEEISIKKEKKNKDDEEKPREEVVRLTTEHTVRMKQEQVERNEVQAKREEEKETAEVKKKMVKEDIGRKGENTRRIDDKMQLKGSEEKKKKDVESMKTQDMIRKEEKTKIKTWKEEMRQNEDQEHRNADEEIKRRPEMWRNEAHEADTKMEHERKTNDKAKRLEEVKKHREEDGSGKKEDGMGNKEDARRFLKGDKENIQTKEGGEEGVVSKTELHEEKRENMKSQNENTGETERSLTSQPGGNTSRTSSSPDPLHSQLTASTTSSETAEQQDLDKNISQSSTCKTDNQQDPAKPGTSSCSLPASLPERTEQKRLLWMKDCTPWSKLALQNRRKQKGSVGSRRGPRRAAEGSSLPPLCPHTLLQSTGWKSLQEVTTVTLEDQPGCSLSTLAQCPHLRSLSLRRCGLKSLEGISHLQELWYIDLQENDISFVDCENMSSLRVLQLAHNKLTSIHGLNGAENLDVLDLSHNSITRIAGLESVRRLQRLSVDHNQLISTKGLRDVFTLLHLDCSHNHLASVEGLESSALLHTLDLRGNSLTEPPSLNNQVLLRELHLDDNSISSLHNLTVCWLPLMQHLSAAQNRITQLPSMSDFVSLENLDLRYNCLSELQNVCESLEGCQFLREIRLTGNPLQQESGWRSTLQKSVPGLRAVDSQETDSFFLPPAVQQVSLAAGCFLTFCQAQLQQTGDLQQRHSRELSKASSPADDVESFCRHLTMSLKLAEDQRFAHEYGDTAGSDKLWAASQTAPEKTLDSVIAEKLMDYREIESTNKIPPVFLKGDNMRCSYWNFEEIPATESHDDTFGPKEGPAASFSDEKVSASSHQDLNLKNAAAVVIQQCWRKYKQKCGNINAPPITEKGGEREGDGRKPEPKPCYNNRSTAGKDYAATVIQAFWRGYTLRRKLTSALAAVTCPSAEEDDTFEEVDIDEFVFDEAALEEHCRLMLSQDSPRRYYPVSEQPSSLKPPGPRLDPSQDILPLPKPAWAAGEHVDLRAQRISVESSNRSASSSSSTSVLSGLSERSEKILEEWGFTDSRTALLMLKRARKMKSKRQLQKKHRDPSVRLALFRNCNYQHSPVEAWNRTTQYKRNYAKVGGAEPGQQQAERTEQVQQDQIQQWLHSQASQSHAERDHFLPDINSSILNGGRVQLVVNPAYADCLHHTSRMWHNSSLTAQGCKVNSYARRNSSSHIRKEVPSATRVPSAPSRNERGSFRDNPVQLSGGWGGGRKRVRK